LFCLAVCSQEPGARAARAWLAESPPAPAAQPAATVPDRRARGAIATRMSLVRFTVGAILFFSIFGPEVNCGEGIVVSGAGCRALVLPGRWPLRLLPTHAAFSACDINGKQQDLRKPHTVTFAFQGPGVALTPRPRRLIRLPYHRCRHQPRGVPAGNCSSTVPSASSARTGNAPGCRTGSFPRRRPVPKGRPTASQAVQELFTPRTPRCRVPGTWPAPWH